MERMMSLVGLIAMVAFCYLLSSHRKSVNWRLVFSGIILQISLGGFILKTEFGVWFFARAKDVATGILDYTSAGSDFVFGPLAKFEVLMQSFGVQSAFIFATMVLPTIVFVSSLMAILYHFGVMQKVVSFTAWVMIKVMGTSGTESLAAAANIFAGQTEAPLAIRPYIERMTNSELLALMVGGMATVAGGVMAAYVEMGFDAGHLIAASVISAPAALVCAKLLLPEIEDSETSGKVRLYPPTACSNFVDAAAVGASEGLKLALNVAAMLLAFVALVALFNGLLAIVGSWFGFPHLSLELMMGYLFSPFAFLMGIPWHDSVEIGALLGKKLVLNEFIAYADLRQIKDQLSPRTVAITTYALCGFANFSSIAIQLGGIGTLAESRRKDLAKLGPKALLGGTIACFMTACVAGLFV